jgi:signal transduction histidine kinase
MQVKFTDTGSIKLIVSAVKPISNGYATIRFAVVDTGIGILEENKRRSLGFFSEDGSTTLLKIERTGLRLTISINYWSYEQSIKARKCYCG